VEPLPYASRSFWLDSVPGSLEPRPPLPGDVQCDVAIVGAGYTGLWTAYYLHRADPSLRIVILEAEIAGFGASGRNGGWCSALFAAEPARLAREHGRPAAIAMQRAMFDTVDEVGKVSADEGIDCHFVKGGTTRFATNPAHVERIRASVEEAHALGFTDDDERWLDAEAAAARVAIPSALGAAHTPHCAAIHPARLARGLADVVERSGVAVYEQTRVQSIDGRSARSVHGTVTAEVVVRATEAWTIELPGLRRAVAPVYSLMLATESLPADVWDEIGWSGRETISDGRHMIIYGQRTADDRIAFGGRGAPYHFGSAIRSEFDRVESVFVDLRRVLADLVPATRGARITHTWGGPLGIPRDWYPSCGYDRRTGMAWAGGYVGDGVATTNLAGRTLSDLITGADTPIVHLPWVQHASPDWEPEPFRWLGHRALTGLARSSDRAEARTGRPARRIELLGKALGG
jgi:glycine/D-amino acid oxidase-like deaminating enzyme